MSFVVSANLAVREDFPPLHFSFFLFMGWSTFLHVSVTEWTGMFCSTNFWDQVKFREQLALWINIYLFWLHHVSPKVLEGAGESVMVGSVSALRDVLPKSNWREPMTAFDLQRVLKTCWLVCYEYRTRVQIYQCWFFQCWALLAEAFT